MAVKKFNLPDPGEGLTEAEVTTWKVKVGDTVGVGTARGRGAGSAGEQRGELIDLAGEAEEQVAERIRPGSGPAGGAAVRCTVGGPARGTGVSADTARRIVIPRGHGFPRVSARRGVMGRPCMSGV